MNSAFAATAFVRRNSPLGKKSRRARLRQRFRFVTRRLRRGCGKLLYERRRRPWIGENIENGSGVVIHETRFVYDGNQIVLQFDESGSGTMTVGDLSHRYLWGPATDQLFSDEQVTSVSEPGTLVLPLTDNVGTVRDLAICSLTSGTTAVVNHLDYSSFGQLLSQTNSATRNAATVDCIFGFTGRPLDKATGLQNNTNRWYDASVGRWISQDPTGFAAGDTNEYRYVGNSPANETDPRGLEPPFLFPDSEGGRRLTDAERAAVLRNARAELEKLGLSGNEIYMRMEIIKAALNHKMGFDNGPDPHTHLPDPASFPSPTFFVEKGGVYVLRPGKVAGGLDDRIFNRSGHSLTGCTRASQLLLLYGEAQLAKKLGDKQAKAFDEAVAGEDIDDLMPSKAPGIFDHYSPNPDRNDLVPGDRVRMNNHKFVRALDGRGYEGSNVIYLGKDDAHRQLFLHMDGGDVERYEALQKTVRSYSKPASRRDPSHKYKFTERYEPHLPSWVEKPEH